MTLKRDDFLMMRKKAMLKRREKIMHNTNAQVVTTTEIAAALKIFTMVNGKKILYVIKYQ